ncbi:MAG: SDR family NAD(P)-dependent oxidoreductase [Planctomycetota bacterium]
MRRFENQNVIVTGSSEGVGRTIAVEFAREGARLVLVNRRPASETERLVAATGACAESIVCDISQEADVVAMGRKAAEVLEGRIDILVNNAGFNGKASLVKDMKLTDWEYTLRVNLTGTMLVCREIVPHMIGRKSGRIVNMASNVARRGLPFRADYVSSKWALLGFTQTLALELVEHNIRVNAVCPGPIEGDRIEQLVAMHAEAEGKSFDEMHKAWENVPMKRFAKPEEVADVVKFLASDESSAMTGQSLNITCGFIMT